MEQRAVASPGEAGDVGRPSGRRRGDSGARTAILDAARQEFASRGYGSATMRGIAGVAAVDPALIRHYFGGKAELFTATLDLPPSLHAQLEEAFAGDCDRLGERVARHYLGLWEDPATAGLMLMMFRSAIDSEEAAGLLRDFVSERTLTAAGRHVLRDRPELRGALASSHLFGTALARYVLKIPPLSEVDLETLVAGVAPVVQRYLTGDLPAECPSAG